MRRILYITSRSDYGGGPEHLYQLARRLSSTDKIYIACPNEEPYYARFSQFAECVEIPHRKLSAASLITLARLVAAKGIDIIHSHGKGAGVYSRLIGVVCRKPVVHSFHGFHYSHLSPVSRIVYLGTERLLGMVTDRFINASESERRVCAEAGLRIDARSAVISNGVDVPAFREKAPGAVFRIINVSRLEQIKGVDILLDIVKELSRITDGFEVSIAGDGPLRAVLEKEAVEMGVADRVVFLGRVPDVMPLLDSADLYLSASRGEGMPLAPLEAMARSLPPVLSDVTGNRDMVVDGKTGFLFDLDSPVEAARKISALMNDKALYNAISRNAYDSVEANYSVEKMCEKTREVYELALNAVSKVIGGKDVTDVHKTDKPKVRLEGAARLGGNKRTGH